jgi:aspartate 4-decarboxylase
VFRLATDHAVVLLSGGGFADSAWSVRVSLANLPAAAYLRVGASLRAVLDAYAADWQESERRAGSTLTPAPPGHRKSRET